MAPLETHSPHNVIDPETWVLYVSHQKSRRLVVFVHGFGGKAVETWTEFPQSGRMGSWWEESDMLFIGYKSMRENITSVADRLRRELPGFYPIPYQPAMNVMGVQARDDVTSPYDELFLVGHSLGGLVIRIALADAAQEWIHASPKPASPDAILSAQTRLFSPASAGFRPGGWKGMVSESLVWPLIEMVLRSSTAYTDLDPESSLIRETRSRTQRFAELGFPALRARVLWANPDDIVLAQIYDSDVYRDSADGKSHTTVCKPAMNYPRPWHFLERGL